MVGFAFKSVRIWIDLVTHVKHITHVNKKKDLLRIYVTNSHRQEIVLTFFKTEFLYL